MCRKGKCGRQGVLVSRLMGYGEWKGGPGGAVDGWTR